MGDFWSKVTGKDLMAMAIILNKTSRESLLWLKNNPSASDADLVEATTQLNEMVTKLVKDSQPSPLEVLITMLNSVSYKNIKLSVTHTGSLA